MTDEYFGSSEFIYLTIFVIKNKNQKKILTNSHLAIVSLSIVKFDILASLMSPGACTTKLFMAVIFAVS